MIYNIFNLYNTILTFSKFELITPIIKLLLKPLKTLEYEKKIVWFETALKKANNGKIKTKGNKLNKVKSEEKCQTTIQKISNWF